MKNWRPQPAKWDWRSFLSVEEAEAPIPEPQSPRYTASERAPFISWLGTLRPM
jgi:hypothetical protein